MTAPESPPSVRKLVSVGGSSAEGYGVDLGSSYPALLSRWTGRPVTGVYRHGVKLAHIAETVKALDLDEDDVLLIHTGLYDALPGLPRPWYQLLKKTRRGRGQLDAYLTDRRLWSRIRRKATHELEEFMFSVAWSIGQTRPRTSSASLQDAGRTLEDSLSSTSALVILVLPGRGSGKPPYDRLPEHYSTLIERTVAVQRQARGLPVGTLHLSELLNDDCYLEDGTHPNDIGHLRIADAALSLMRAFDPSIPVSPRRGP